MCVGLVLHAARFMRIIIVDMGIFGQIFYKGGLAKGLNYNTSFIKLLE